MRRMLRATLASHGYDAVEARNAAEGLALTRAQRPEVVLLDLGLPDRDGLELMRELRSWATAPIIVISARGREQDKVAALDEGADDYLTKPFGTAELLARVRVALRHAAERDATSDSLIEVGPITIDRARHEVRRSGALVHLTPIEHRLLVALARSAGRVLTHRQLLLEVWGPDAATQTHYLRVYMTHLRRKLETDPARPQWLLNEPGVGYRMREA
ncbi:response regulator [Sandaracinus amylolyticus]|uniref:response regulator n=1 Tax=Sandaracinus amylolyticus TaxID=927083 RepID=UPI001EFFB52F